MATTTIVLEAYKLESILSSGVSKEEASEVLQVWQRVRDDVIAYNARCTDKSCCCPPLSDPLMLLRFLRARDNDVDEAALMFREALAWREERIPRALGDIGSAGESGEWKPHAKPEDSRTMRGQLALRHGHSRKLKIVADDGAPILVWRLGKFDLSGVVREAVGDAMAMAQIAHLEDALQTCRALSIKLRKLIRARVIIDLAGLRISSAVANFSVLKRMLSLSKMYFPEVTASVTIINAPFGFQTLWTLVSLILNEHMKSKIKICGSGNHASVFRTHAHVVNVDDLPKAIGGKASNDVLAPCLPIPKGTGAEKRLKEEEPFVVLDEDFVEG